MLLLQKNKLNYKRIQSFKKQDKEDKEDFREIMVSEMQVYENFWFEQDKTVLNRPEMETFQAKSKVKCGSITFPVFLNLERHMKFPEKDKKYGSVNQMLMREKGFCTWNISFRARGQPKLSIILCGQQIRLWRTEKKIQG